MVEKLGKIGGVLKELSDAVITAKLLQKEGSDLGRITEETKKATNEIKELQIPNEPRVDEMHNKVPELCDSADDFIQKFIHFTQEIAPLDKYVEDNMLVSNIPLEVVKEFCKMMENLHERGMAFSKAFSTFILHLDQMQKLAVEITENLNKMENKNNEADWSKVGYGGAAGLVVAGVGFGALAFFTGGLSLLAAGAVAAAGGVAAGCVGMTTYMYLDVKELHSNADRISRLVNKLNLIGKHIKSINNRAEKIELDKKSIEALKVALDLYKNKLEGMENKEKLFQAEAQLKENKEELARKNAELEELRAQIKRLGK